MANSVDLVIGSEAIKQVENLVAKLSLADAELLKISQTAASASKGISGISTPSGLDKTVQSTTALNAQLEKQNTIITKLHADIAKKAEQSRLAEIRLQQQREKAFDSFEKNLQKEESLNAKNESAYQRIQNSVNLLTKTYNDLAIKKQLGGTLTAKEESQLTSLTTRISTYQKALLATDATIGKHQRNVGNYASGYNALGNSINQLTREAPAFANSLNTGFMAISNNIPALTDAIAGIREQNKLLAAEGKPTQSVLSQLAASFFSWQTAISLGVTLLTIYGGKLVEWIMNTDKEKEALDRLTESHKKQNAQLKEANETLEHQNVLAVENAKQRGAATKEIQALDKKLAEDQLKNFETVRDARKKEYDDFIKTEARKNLYWASPEGFKERLKKEEERLKKLNSVQKNALIEAENDVKIQGKVLSELTEKQQTVLVVESEKKKAKQKKAKREDLDHLESYIKPVSDTISQINTQIESLKVIRITGTPEEREEAKKDIETLIELKKQLMGGSPTGGALPDFVVPDNAPSQNKLKTDWKDTFNSIADSAQQAGDIMAEFSQRNFDNEYRRLEAQKDISLKFAGDSAAAKQKIEADYEKKRNEIANRENKAKQKQAIFNIAIDTAQAIMATVGKTGFAGLPLALILGALGAAQIAMVASQKIPQYFDGTDNHIGGMMLVNDGAGANFQEKVILPNGKEIIPEGRNVLMNAPKGTKVLTHEQQIMEMLNERGISMSRNYQTNGGMTANEMDSVMGKHFAKIQVNQTNYDRKGFSSWLGSNGNRTIQNNNRVSRTGFKV